MARSIAIAVVISLVASTTGIVLFRFFSMRHSLETSARNFSGLVSVPLAQVADMYGEEDLREPATARVSRLMQLNQDVETLEMVRWNGLLAISADRDRVMVWPRDGSAPTVGDLEVLGRIKAQSESSGRVRADGGTIYRVIIPGESVGDSFALSLVATFSYDRVFQQIRRGALFLALALALGLVITERVSASLARGITKNLADLQSVVRRIRAGRLDMRVSIKSGDEIEELAEAFNDMTADLRHTITRLRRANKELQALDQVKADLVANISHELRTPLTALKGFLELLDEGELGDLADEAHRAITVCRRNVDRLALRVEDLVQLSQMEKTWPEDPSAEPFDLLQLISMITEIYEMRINSKRLRFSFERPETVPAFHGNIEQIERVLINLVDNAVKFTPEGGRVEIHVEECDHESREGVLIRVVDSGIGIPPGQLVRIFDRFHQVDPSIRRRFGGMGLGLSLVHHIVESHHGLVWAESEAGEGATFFVWLPCRPDEGRVKGGSRVEV